MVSIAYEPQFIIQNMKLNNANSPKPFSEDDITCCLTLKTFGLLTLDAICCLPCCCFCGGCCGKYLPFVYKLDEKAAEQTKPGSETCSVVCCIQAGAAILLPCTCCGCLYCCCGIGTPCAKMAFRQMKKNENNTRFHSSSIMPITAPEIQAPVRR